jgi:hypothetical protein
VQGARRRPDSRAGRVLRPAVHGGRVPHLRGHRRLAPRPGVISSLPLLGPLSTTVHFTVIWYGCPDPPPPVVHATTQLPAFFIQWHLLRVREKKQPKIQSWTYLATKKKSSHVDRENLTNPASTHTQGSVTGENDPWPVLNLCFGTWDLPTHTQGPAAKATDGRAFTMCFEWNW